jgi:hypothetical protein
MSPPCTRSLTWRACLAGRLPAEVLPTVERERLVETLWARAWTDAEIASHTFMTTYTTARIRERLKLPPNGDHEVTGTGKVSASASEVA